MKVMKKLLLIIFLSVVTLFLVGCNDKKGEPIKIGDDEEILQQYDFRLGKIIERRKLNDGFTYAIEIKNDIIFIKSNKLFSVWDTVLLVEVQENKTILIDLD